MLFFGRCVTPEKVVMQQIWVGLMATSMGSTCAG